MKVTHLNLLVSLVVSVFFLASCSSSSSPAPTTGAESGNPTGNGSESGGGGTVTENPGAGSSGGGNAALSGSVASLGMMNLTYQEIEDDTNISGFFFGLNSSVTGAQLQAGLDSETAITDTCEVVDSGSTGDPGSNELDIDAVLPNLNFIPTTVSAGDVITLTSPAGTFASLLPASQFGFTIYNTTDDVDISGSVPAGTTVDIPGAAFPAFANAPVAPAGPLDFSLEGSVDTGFSMTWNGSNANRSVMVVELAAFDQAGSDFSSATAIRCSLLDDGSHSLPAALLPQGNRVIISGGTVSRTIVNVVQQGTAVLIVTSTSDGFVAPAF